MHPILSQFRRLVLYLLAWVPLGAVLLFLLTFPGDLTWQRALAMVIPLCLIYAFICLSAWWSCRSTPLETSGFSRFALTHLSAAFLLSLFWIVIARGLAVTLSTFDSFRGLDRQIHRTYPLLLGSGVFLYLLAVALHYVLLSIEASREAEHRENQARVLARESELKALKAQVNPHFLFNSLNSISALTAIDPGRAREMCLLLADFLRKTLGLGDKIAIPLQDELSLVQSFLSVEKIRFGSRFKLEETIQTEALDCLVPPLLLQPLLENAVSHGISNLTEGGWIRLAVSQNGADDLSILVENNFDPEMPPRRGTGTGLRNVRQRLDTRYGNRASFEARKDGDHFRVSLRLPAERSTTQQ